MKTMVKKTLKFTGGVCAALGIVAVGAVVASSSAVKVVAEGLKAAGKAMKQTVEELKEEAGSPVTETEVVPTAEMETVSSADFVDEETVVSEN